MKKSLSRLSLCALLCLALLPCPCAPAQVTAGGGASGAADNAEAVAAWLGRRAIPLKSLDAGHGFDDLQPLKKILKGVSLVGLGEGTHGTHEFFRFKHRMVEFLVREEGFTVLAMEVSYPASVAINDYVLDGKGSRDEALAKQGTWAWDTQEVSELLEWMRRYNSTAPPEKRVRFVGFDLHNNEAAIEGVESFLGRFAPQRVEAFREAVRPMRASGLGRQHFEYIAQVSAAQKEKTFAALVELLGFLNFNRTRFSLETSPAEVGRVIEYARVLAQFADIYRKPPADAKDPSDAIGSSRDFYMAENIARVFDAEKPGTRVVVWAHNDHVGKYRDAMGDFLRRFYGARYYALGSAFNQGSFQAREVTPDATIGALTEFTVGPATEGSVEWYLARAGVGDCLLDLRGLSSEEAGRRWLSAPRMMRSIGLGYSRRGMFSRRTNLQEVFDGLVFVEKTTRARPNPTGMREAWNIPEKNQDK